MININDGIKNENRIKSFLMIGQSNMAGRGEFGEVSRIENENCFMLRMGRWQPMSEPINPDRDIFNILFHSGVSLAASFADSVQKHENCKVGLIPCADGGTMIEQWLPDTELFDHAVFQTKLALRNSNLGGIIWHQGESDCCGDLEKYKENLILVMKAFRKELNAENIPIIMGELSNNIDKKYACATKTQEMNEVIHAVANELDLCAVASSEGLEIKPDGLHFNSASLRILGERYFEEYLKLTK